MTKPYYEKREITDFKDLINQSVSIYGNKNAFSVKGMMGEYTGIKYKEFKKYIFTKEMGRIRIPRLSFRYLPQIAEALFLTV